MACIVNQCNSIADSFHYLEQDFAKRNLKAGYFALGTAWENFRRASSPEQLAEEFAHLALAALRKFDKFLASYINNSCKCQIGSKPLQVDGNSLLDDLEDFYIVFMTPITDCKVNDFLNLSDARSSASKVISDPKAAKGSAAQQLKKYQEDKQWITCKECAKIGDVVIALEQPRSWTLVHGDKKSFPDLCAALGKKEVYVSSVQATQHADPNLRWRLQGPPSQEEKN